jgi:hypothetical protein
MLERVVTVSEPQLPNSNPLVSPQSLKPAPPKIAWPSSIGRWMVDNRYVCLGVVFIVGGYYAIKHIAQSSAKKKDQK